MEELTVMALVLRLPTLTMMAGTISILAMISMKMITTTSIIKMARFQKNSLKPLPPSVASQWEAMLLILMAMVTKT